MKKKEVLIAFILSIHLLSVYMNNNFWSNLQYDMQLLIPIVLNRYEQSSNSLEEHENATSISRRSDK
jgi:uncharacterized membrane protein YqhA